MTALATDNQPDAPLARQFWCHECACNVETREDEAGGELCCMTCDGNFVEEVEADDPPEQFLAEAPAAPSAEDVRSHTNDNDTQTEHGQARSTLRQIFDGGAGLHYVTPQTPPSDTARRVGFATDAQARDESASTEPNRTGRPGRVHTDLNEFLHQLVGGGDGSVGGGTGTRAARIIRSDGTPVEVYVTSAGEARDDFGGEGFFGLLRGMAGLNPRPFGGLAGNPGDYALGPNHLSQLINQLMQNDPNRHGAPPAAKEVVDKLPKRKIEQREVDSNVECAVCKDLFAVDEDAHDLPCTHSFHPDCIMPWLKMHNSCPVCRFELPTDDQDYETRRRHEQRREQRGNAAA